MSLSAQDVADLIARVASKRDRAAFTILFDHFAPRINAYLYKMGADSTAAEELTQEVMLTLWRKADLFDPAKSSLATWLYRVARNRRIDMLRRMRGQETDLDAAGDVPDSAPLIDTQLDGFMREDRVREVMKTLPPDRSLRGYPIRIYPSRRDLPLALLNRAFAWPSQNCEKDWNRRGLPRVHNEIIHRSGHVDVKLRYASRIMGGQHHINGFIDIAPFRMVIHFFSKHRNAAHPAKGRVEIIEYIRLHQRRALCVMCPAFKGFESGFNIQQCKFLSHAAKP
jgi:RNA polymerase sigma factor (sigma-70 family)